MALKVVAIEKSYGELKVLDGISFDVKPNEFICIVGESGCGKTTLLKIIAGIEKADKGEVVFGKDNPKIGFVFQDARVLPWKTVIGNIEFVLDAAKMDRAIAKEIIQFVGLSGFENYYPKQLSGGMLQRLSIGRALAINPDVLLMDEPFANLDALTKQKMHRELIRIVSNKTVVFVTHDIEEAIYLADRIIILSPRPAKVVDIVEIDIPKPRNIVSEEFLEYKRLIYSLL